MLLCINDALPAEVSCNPLKNNKKGTEPPNSPIEINLSQSFFFSALNSLNFEIPKTSENKNNDTKRFFKNVKTLESMPLTPNWFMNIEKPLIMAVENINNKALFFITRIIS